MLSFQYNFSLSIPVVETLRPEQNAGDHFQNAMYLSIQISLSRPKIIHHWFHKWFGTIQVTSQYVNQLSWSSEMQYGPHCVKKGQHVIGGEIAFFPDMSIPISHVVLRKRPPVKLYPIACMIRKSTPTAITTSWEIYHTINHYRTWQNWQYKQDQFIQRIS